jgi:hypothetical protein
VLDHRRTRPWSAEVAGYATRHPGFAQVLWMLERDDAEEGEG